MNEKNALDHEMIDLLVTLGIAFRIHKGKPKMMRRTAEKIFKRLQFEETKVVCEKFIRWPEKTEFRLNVVTESFYGRQILLIT